MPARVQRTELVEKMISDLKKLDRYVKMGIEYEKVVKGIEAQEKRKK